MLPVIPHGGRHVTKGYPAEFRKRVLGLIASRTRVADVARDLGISNQTIYSWRHQECVDQGLEVGLTSTERAELTAARRCMRELETELAVHRKAAELLKANTSQRGSPPPR